MPVPCQSKRKREKTGQKKWKRRKSRKIEKYLRRGNDGVYVLGQLVKVDRREMRRVVKIRSERRTARIGPPKQRKVHRLATPVRVGVDGGLIEGNLVVDGTL